MGWEYFALIFIGSLIASAGLLPHSLSAFP